MKSEKLFSRRELLKEGGIFLSSASLFWTVLNCGLSFTGCGSKDTVVVKNRDELKKAVENKVKKIIAKGELANQVKTSYDIRKASKVAIVALGTALLAAGITAPLTGGTSYAFAHGAASGIAALTGFEVATIVAIAALGISLTLAITKEYDIIKFRAGKDDAYVELELQKTKNDKNDKNDKS